MRVRITWIMVTCMWGMFLCSCNRNNLGDTCMLSAIVNGEGDTLTTLEYEDGLLVRINEKNPASVRRFVYDDSVLTRQEFFGTSTTLQRYRSYVYGDSSMLTEMVEYRVNLNGEWLPAYREEYSQYAGGFPAVIKAYALSETSETLSAFYDLLWRDEVITRVRRWEAIPSSPGALRIASIQTFTHDSRLSPWPDIPAIDIWKRRRNPLSLITVTREYLPQGDINESLSQERYEYRYDRDSKVIEAMVTAPTGQGATLEYLYDCESQEE